MFNVRFEFIDDYNRSTFRTWFNTNPLIATVLADITVLATALDGASVAGLAGVTISQTSLADVFPQVADANKDDNMSIKVSGGDNRNYDFNLPMPIPAIINPDGTLVTASPLITAIFDLFLVGAVWRINLNNPTDITAVIGGTLDK